MMSDPDIQFGEVEETPPAERRRPDRDRHFAVVDYGTPAEGDLPIFVDLDALADMEAHAGTDTSVELGGVLLGGQYVDEEGCPFVLVSDSLRAEHYESDRGHFKFTHDTWTRISRQREEFSDDLQMVGWYHTHPGWGVFLSGMDRFICDHFFDRPLDVALVIDPVKGDRGWFYWNRQGGERLPQAGGFRATASRFRRRELAAYVARLEAKTTMKTGLTPGEAAGVAPETASHVFHTVRPQLGWLGGAVLAVLVLQACLTLAVALRLGPAGSPGGPREEAAAAVGEEEAGPRELQLQRREEQLEARRRLLDEIIGHVRVDAEGRIDVSTLAEEHGVQKRQIERLERDGFLLSELTESYQALKQEHSRSLAEVAELKGAQAELEGDNEQLRKQLGEAGDARDEALADARAARAEIDRLKSPAAGEEETGEKPEEPAEDRMSPWTIVLIVIAVVVAALAAAVLAGVLIRRKRSATEPEPEDQSAVDEP